MSFVATVQPAAAQQEIGVGAIVKGELAPGDAPGKDGGRRDIYVFQASGDERIVVQASSDDFDLKLTIDGPNGYHKETEDDALLDTTLSVGSYRISVTSHDHAATGAYELMLDAVAPELPDLKDLPLYPTAPRAAPPAMPKPATPTQASGPLLDVRDTLRPDDLGGSKSFSLRLIAGQQVFVLAESTVFDTFLRIEGPGYEAENDNQHGFNYGAPRTYATSDIYNSAVYVLAPASGEYRFWISKTRDDEEGGPFRIRATALPPINVDSEVKGQLAAGDFLGMNGDFVDSFAVSGRAGQMLSVQVDATQFSPRIAVRGPNEFESNAMEGALTVPLPEDGDYRVTVGATWPGQGGSYILRVR